MTAAIIIATAVVVACAVLAILITRAEYRR